ncbi:hypothetical protein [Streptomyces sp. CBMA152]|uniref:hypothetical protein n=1 Tax=unclassified Streptomyces TaxID=2593676 RepID=UPI0016600DBD|nr:hypothetical protein [Streptomyces sp. CBMA152]MBD0741788.1 hypothetical protein [Streptomyces sp. CBMA152]
MRASRALPVAVAAFAAVGLSAPLAAANFGPSNVSVSPNAVHQGGILTITANGCGHGGIVTSNAFHPTSLSGGDTGFATARVFDHVSPGSYNLSVRCNDNPRTETRSFTVLPGRGAMGGLGGSVGPTQTEMAVGGSLVAAAAIGGAVFVVRRRRTASGRL